MKKSKPKQPEVDINRKEKTKSQIIDPKNAKLKATISSTVIKPPPPPLTQPNDNDNQDDDPNQKIAKSRRMRSLTVTKKDYQPEIDDQQTGGEINGQLPFDKQASFPEIANDLNPYKFPLDYTKKLNHKFALSMDQIKQILDIIHEPLNFIFSDNLNCYFVTDALENITIFNQSLFIASVKQEDQSFYEFLLESQTFQDYVEIKLDEFSSSKCTDPSKRRRSAFGQSGGRRRRASTVKKVIKIFD